MSTDPAATATTNSSAVVAVPAPRAPATVQALRRLWSRPIHLRRTLNAMGVSDDVLRRRVRERELVRPRRGAYAKAADYQPLDLRGRHAMTARAVWMAAVADVSLSHSSALVWYGCPDWGLDLSLVHLLRHDRRAGRREAGVCQHRGELVAGDVVQLAGMTVVSPCRAALEITTLASVEVALTQVNYLLHTAQTTLTELEDRFSLMREWPCTLRTQVVLRLADARIESVLESRFYYFCFKHSLPMPEVQYVVEDHDGIVVARLDFAWPSLGKFVELDGAIKYGELLKEDETARDVVLREKERDKLVKRLTGLEGDRLTWHDLDDEALLLARLKTFLFGS